MVVCKCRKATKLYCFVHKVPVCGECICFPEHQICVVRTYSEWVIDGDYDWPHKCCHCQAVLAEGTDLQTTRLGCLHVIHTNCLVSHVKSFPVHTPPSEYNCPACSTPIWPPKSIKDSASSLHSKLKEAIMQICKYTERIEKVLVSELYAEFYEKMAQIAVWVDLEGADDVDLLCTGMEKNIFGNQPVSLQGAESRSPPPAFASEPLMHASDAASTTTPHNLNSLKIDTGSSPLHNHDPNFMKSTSPTGPGATTRKSTMQMDRQNSEVPYYAEDEDANRKKYSRRGTFRHKFLRSLLPFWSSSLPTLPVTAPPKKDVSHGDDTSERHPTRQRKSSRMDPRKLLLFIAIMACMATMGILYYRIAREMGAKLLDDELQ